MGTIEPPAGAAKPVMQVAEGEQVKDEP
jgi:hypothetical protein